MPRLTTTTEGPFKALFCVALALALLVVFTLARAILNPILGSQSPYMLYIAAVLIAGFARGGFCGFLVMLGGGIAGLMLFAGWNGHLGAIGAPAASLACFWAVSALALMMANELRRHANLTFERMRRQVEAASPRTGDAPAAGQRAA
jgi:hypothetical protein